MSLTSQEHVELPHLWLEVDGCTEKMEGWCILLHSQVDEAQIIQNLPVEGCQVVGSFQAADSLEERAGTRWEAGASWQNQQLNTNQENEETLTATYFFLPKKHIPMLFQSGGLSGTAQATILYLVRATSKSPWVCIMLPAAKMAWKHGIWKVGNSVIPKRLLQWSSLPECRYSAGPSALVGLKSFFQGPIYYIQAIGTDAHEEHSRTPRWLSSA